MFYWMALLADLQGINLKSSREQTRLLMSFGGVGTRHQCQRWESGWCVGSNLKFEINGLYRCWPSCSQRARVRTKTQRCLRKEKNPFRVLIQIQFTQTYPNRFFHRKVSITETPEKLSANGETIRQ